eukprot:COSAG01_NODE_2158_length_8251_cov_8.554645_6_plen_128_part_00
MYQPRRLNNVACVSGAGVSVPGLPRLRCTREVGGEGGGDCRAPAGLLERHGPCVDLFGTRAREPVPGDCPCPCPCPPQEEAEKEKHAALEAARREAEAGEALRREQVAQAVRGLACMRACIYAVAYI